MRRDVQTEVIVSPIVQSLGLKLKSGPSPDEIDSMWETEWNGELSRDMLHSLNHMVYSATLSTNPILCSLHIFYHLFGYLVIKSGVSLSMWNWIQRCLSVCSHRDFLRGMALDVFGGFVPLVSLLEFHPTQTSKEFSDIPMSAQEEL